MVSLKKSLAALTALACGLAAAPTAAQEFLPVGPRALGMGGAGVAAVTDTTAQYYNPAAFGFFNFRDEDGQRFDCDNNDCGRKVWGTDLDAAFGYRLHNEFGKFLDPLSDLDIKQFDDGVQSASELRNLVEVMGNLSGLSDPGNAITADVSAGLAARIGHFGFGVRTYLQATGRVVSVDTQNFGVGTNFNDQLNDIEGLSGDGTFGYFTQSEQELLLADDKLTEANLQAIDLLIRDAGISRDQAATLVDLLNSVAANDDPDLTISQNNTTTVALDGFGLMEVPLSYGYALNEHWSVGGSLKFMLGRVYGTQLFVFDTDSGDTLSEIRNDYNTSANFGLDLGVMGRYKYVNFGLVARNINAPKFDGFTKTTTLSNGQTVSTQVQDVRVDPQVRAGVAFIPFTTLTLAADLDLTENDTSFSAYKSRYASLGVEWDAFRILALRAGAYKNLADSDIDWVLTGGLGLNLWAVRLDLAGAMATEKEEFDGRNLPREGRLAAMLSVDF
ncbi:conjugal transfer protein TraF [Geoalkalibacter halelectricus]|uniref:Conjugal transfer protein TraF n=1 Tax=Geoalkalibacter halelectricus TaxID=2847045 RepID=A0ABY5ZTD3_9BACT|nr:conjugal transfer protein TraF [Geoalkalibacter halelectricus]MDO3376995.1 conjugal transfer protein TraF [Geoalkalibacter halelectricus]UWZ81217.1 conjugal transfer protein TraF [Geoalkalibacter halelectricus]